MSRLNDLPRSASASLRAAAAACIIAVVLSGCAEGTLDADSVAPQTVGASNQSAAEQSAAAKKAAAKKAAAKLDAYVALARQQVKSVYGDAFEKMYSEVRVESTYPSGIEFVYVYKEFVDASAARTQLDSFAPTLETTFETMMASEMERAGIARPRATWTYRNADGTMIWTHTVKRS